jgi:hypothetical protein
MRLLALTLLCTLAHTAQAGVLSVDAEAFGYVDGVLFHGKGEGHMDGTGDFTVKSLPEGDISCTGNFDHDFTQGGKGKLTCTNNESADFIFKFTGFAQGYGEGNSQSHGPVRFSFGLKPDEASKVLGLPAGSRIVGSKGQYRLQKAEASVEASPTVAVPVAASSLTP